ncbi:MAG: BMP family ABC transporter substrate-binding protein, partial [Sphaerochaetaceae bacterium]|nr:BMP family ABC transporter substrate-binding protein [Sphaerochaetaceae bacterium]
MKKFLSLLLVSFLAVGLFACGGEEETYEIALVTDVGNIDDESFNQGAWEGVVEYGDEFEVSYTYYRPSEDSDAARIETIEAAIAAGAKVVVCPGYLFETAIYSVQDDYPEVSFLLLDGEPQAGDYTTYFTADNTHNVLYQEEQAGFLAGYAAVMDGYRELGFVGGMAVPAVVRYGYGYVQGAEYAATELGLTAGDVNIKYYYAGAFEPSTDLEAKMDVWYVDGTEIVFACGGSLYESVVAAAESAGADVIGVDVDQSSVSDTIITSAMKGLTVSVYDALTEFYDNDEAWPEDLAGVTSTLGASTNGIGLPTADDSWGFATFTLAQYEAIFALLVDETVVVDSATDTVPTTTLV